MLGVLVLIIPLVALIMLRSCGWYDGLLEEQRCHRTGTGGAGGARTLILLLTLSTGPLAVTRGQGLHGFKSPLLTIVVRFALLGMLFSPSAGGSSSATTGGRPGWLGLALILLDILAGVVLHVLVSRLILLGLAGAAATGGKGLRLVLLLGLAGGLALLGLDFHRYISTSSAGHPDHTPSSAPTGAGTRCPLDLPLLPTADGGPTILGILIIRFFGHNAPCGTPPRAALTVPIRPHAALSLQPRTCVRPIETPWQKVFLTQADTDARTDHWVSVRGDQRLRCKWSGRTTVL